MRILFDIAAAIGILFCYSVVLLWVVWMGCKRLDKWHKAQLEEQARREALASIEEDAALLAVAKEIQLDRMVEEWRDGRAGTYEN